MGGKLEFQGRLVFRSYGPGSDPREHVRHLVDGLYYIPDGQNWITVKPLEEAITDAMRNEGLVGDQLAPFQVKMGRWRIVLEPIDP